MWWMHQTVLVPFPTNFFTGIHYNSQEQKVGSMGRWVVPSNGSYQHVKMWSRQRMNPRPPKHVGAPLQQVVKLLCAETGVLVTAFDFFPLRNILWETVFMGAGYHYTRSWKSTVLSSESLSKYLNPQSPSFSSKWKEDPFEFLSAHFLHFPSKRNSIWIQGCQVMWIIFKAFSLIRQG